MTTEPAPSPKRGLFSRAEMGARHVVLEVGLGFVAFVLGSILSAGASTRLLERMGPITSDGASWLFSLIVSRLWIFAVLPLIALAVGRTTGLSGRRFALVSGLSGELFGVLLTSGLNGFEVLVASPLDVVARIVTLAVGLGIVWQAFEAGRAGALEAETQARALSERNRRLAAEQSTPQSPPAAP